jgi:TPR repeat protein
MTSPLDDRRPSRQELRARARSGDPEADYQLAQDLLEREPIDGVEGFEWLLLAAEQGHARAQTLLGVAHGLERVGDGSLIQHDPARSRSWLERAAVQGHAEAMMLLGSKMLQGSPGFEGSEGEGHEWIRQAAEGGDAASQLNHAFFLLDRAPPDPDQARAWIRRAAAQGYAPAEYELATRLRAEGHRDAVRWFEAAESHEHAEAAYDLGQLYRSGELVEPSKARAEALFYRARQLGSPRAQLDHGLRLRARGKAHEGLVFLRKAADQGLAEGQFQLAEALVDREEAEAVRQYERAAAQGHLGALVNLGYCFANAIGVPEDPARAARCYQIAADQGQPVAQYNFALSLHNGVGVPKDRARANAYHRRAAEQGHVRAQCTLGVHLLAGIGGAPDPVEAARWLRLAGEQGSALAQSALGALYAAGAEGVPVDEAEAVRWYEEAAAQGDEEAQAYLASR